MRNLMSITYKIEKAWEDACIAEKEKKMAGMAESLMFVDDLAKKMESRDFSFGGDEDYNSWYGVLNSIRDFVNNFTWKCSGLNGAELAVLGLHINGDKRESSKILMGRCIEMNSMVARTLLGENKLAQMASVWMERCGSMEKRSTKDVVESWQAGNEKC